MKIRVNVLQRIVLVLTGLILIGLLDMPTQAGVPATIFAVLTSGFLTFLAVQSNPKKEASPPTQEKTEGENITT